MALKWNDSPAVIKEINSNKTAVVELDEGAVIIVQPGEVLMVQPQEHGMVHVTGGADVGVEVELFCIDGTDAILKELITRIVLWNDYINVTLLNALSATLRLKHNVKTDKILSLGTV
eukprot:14856561-Ditylum_brightwellii.AAC.1